jgi:uncharacterized protein GlcG (DUF336 family)
MGYKRPRNFERKPRSFLLEERLVIRTALLSCFASLALGVFSADAPIVNYKTLSQEAAEAVADAAKQAAANLESPIYKPAKTKMHVHVIGREGTLMAATQANGAWPGSADIAGRKARTSFFFKLPTRTIGELSRPELDAKGPLYGIEHSNSGLITFPGGLPLFDKEGGLVGAIGVSGDTVDADEQVAKAGVEALSKLTNPFVDLPSISVAGAKAIVAAAEKKAAETQSPIYKVATKMHIHVIGVEGTLVASSQADGSWPGSDDIATKKARTAFFFKLPSHVIGDLSRPEKKDKGPLYRIEHSNNGLISFPGGLPLFDDKGNCIGAIGVSGDTVEKDLEVAQAGADALKALLKK